MRPLVIAGLVLIVLGALALAWGGFSFTTTEKLAEVGPLKLERQQERHVAVPPVAGVVAVAAGVVLVIVGSRRR